MTGAAASSDAAALLVATDDLLAREDLAASRGWLKFLRFELDAAVAREGAGSAAASEKRARLETWVERLQTEPGLPAALRGVHEWAYESRADDSGQPFKIAIPADYDPARPLALSVYLHGYGGNHLEHSTGLAERTGWINVAVLGRARGGGYLALSEADVLDVIDYVQAHWAVDPARIHLNGGSMGGGGTFRLASRYPHRFASGRPVCGFATHLPLGNLLTFPVYATHSDDDYVVSVLHARGPLAWLRERGGRALLDETTGLGHAAWDYHEGNARGDAWAQALVRPDSRTVRRIDFTALDGHAARGWWAEVAEWGPAPRPARFQLLAGETNELQADLTNIRRLQLRLDEAPVDLTLPLRVSVDGMPWITLPAPLPARIELVQDNAEAWAFAAPAAPAGPRLHTPGGAALLYHGEPLLIVYGTTGDTEAVTAMRTAAEAAAKSPNPAWQPDGGEAGGDGVPHLHNLYGGLRIKPDQAVTAEDLARCHLVLIGSARENSIVARLADRLPVQFSAGKVSCSDGFRVTRPGLALGLVHYNPLAPDRLIFWVAADTPAAYAPGAMIPQLMIGSDIAGQPSGIDLVVGDAMKAAIVATRTFDSRWQWNDARDQSPLLPATLSTHADATRAVAAAVRRLAGTDFGVVSATGPQDHPPIEPGVTRVCDILPLFFYNPLGLVELTGAEVLELAPRFDQPFGARWWPQPDPSAIDPRRTYTLAMPSSALWPFTRTIQRAPAFRHTRLTLADALERHLVPAPGVSENQP